MKTLYQALLILLASAGVAAAQTCPSTTTACPSPTYNTVTVGGALTASGGGTISGTYAGTPTLSGNWNFSGGLTGTLTGGATLDLPLVGGTMTGALHMGTNAIDGSAVAFTGGAMNGVTIGAITPEPGAFVSLGVGGTSQTFPPSGLIAGTTDTQTLTNKSIAGGEINSGTVGSNFGGAGAVTGALKGNGSGVVSQAACADLSNGGTGCSATIPAAGIVQSNGTALGNVTVSTGLAYSGTTLSSNAVTFISFSPGPATSVSSTKGAFYKTSKAMTFDNIEGSALAFTCGTNPTVTFYECGTSTTCATPTTIGTVTVTAAGTVVDGTISAAAVTAGDYVAAEISAGVCTNLNIVATAQLHAN